MKHIRVERSDGVGVVTIDRVARLNSMDVETAQEFRQAALGLARDGEVRCVVLRGAGGVFSSGADLKHISGGGDGRLAYLSPDAREVPRGHGEVFKQILEYIHSAISEIRRAPKPFIAAVDGPAAAGGLGIAIACDLVLASERAWFEWAYSKTGLTGAESSTFFLPRLVGLRFAQEMAFLNPRLTAREALARGLVTRVLPTEGFDDAVLAIARQLADGPTKAFAVTKRLFNESSGGDRLDVHLDRELDELVRIANGPELAEGLAAFLEKRPPRFR